VQTFCGHFDSSEIESTTWLSGLTVFRSGSLLGSLLTPPGVQGKATKSGEQIFAFRKTN